MGAITEHQVKKMFRVKRYVHAVLGHFNEHLQGFLKTRAFIMPVAGNGIDCRNSIEDDDFHKKLDGNVARFAFGVKFMKAEKESVNSESYLADYADWHDFSKGGKSTVEVESWLRDKWQLHTLIEYQHDNGHYGN